MLVSHVWSYICLQVIVNLCLISLYMHELWFCAKILPPLSCKSNNTTKRHHMWSSDLLHFTLYYMLFVPQTSNLFLNISYGSVFLKMCYIMWLWCHRNITNVIRIYRIRKDGGGGGGSSSCWKKKNRRHVKISRSATPLHNTVKVTLNYKIFIALILSTSVECFKLQESN